MMRILLDVPPLFFMHIPKAGGHTTGNWIARHYRGRSLTLRPEVLARLTPADVPSYRFYHSWHFGRGMLDLIQRPDLSVFTVLRDPVERDLSQLEHKRRAVKRFPRAQPPEYLAHVQPYQNSPIWDFHQAYHHFRLIGNRQTHILGTHTDYRSFVGGGGGRRDAARRNWPTPPPEPELPISPAEQLVEARRWLDQMAVVGINERFTESMTLISAAFGLPLLRAYRFRNQNPNRMPTATFHYRQQLNPEQINEFTVMNRYDYELYGYAVERFERDWSRFLARPRRSYSIAAYAGRAADAVRHRLSRPVKPDA